MDADGTLYQDMDRLVALERGLRTWAEWVDANIDISRTRLFFQGISPTHYKYVAILSLSTSPVFFFALVFFSLSPFSARQL